MKAVAKRKLMDVTGISAEFNGTELVFGPIFSLFVDQGKTADFAAAYLPGGNGDDELPAICLRRARWNQGTDYAAFESGLASRAYLDSDRQLVSRLLFGNKDLRSLIQDLIKPISATFRRGLELQSVSRSEPLWQYLECELIDESASYSLSYWPSASMNPNFEGCLADWLRAIEDIDFGGGLLPLDRCRLSYEPSLLESISAFPAS
jgi:hypothetical protein